MLSRYCSFRWSYCLGVATVLVLLITAGRTLWQAQCLNSFTPQLDGKTTFSKPGIVQSVHPTNAVDAGADNHAGAPSNDSFVASAVNALQPVTFTGCCGEGRNLFETTCLTMDACDKFGLYPFDSKEQKSLFEPWEPTVQEMQDHRQRCDEANGKFQPSTSWCASDNRLGGQHPHPIGCSRYGMGAGSGPYDRVVLYTKGKLAFCGIPKSGITQWLQFLRFTLGAKDYQSVPYFKNDVGRFYMDRLKPTVQQHIWKNWTKAVLIRNPAERLLSAFLDKVYKEKPNPRSRFRPNITFAEFVDILANNSTSPKTDRPGLSWFTDPHWRPQAWSCGLSENLPHMDYIGSLNMAAHHAKGILQQVDMWELYGKHYRISKRGETKGSVAAKWPPPPLKPGEEAAVGFQQRDGMDTMGHNQMSSEKLDQYYNPDLMEKVRDLYWMDFQLWDAVQQAEKEGIVTGREIARELNPNC